jgi:hypothetical protein
MMKKKMNLYYCIYVEEDSPLFSIQRERESKKEEEESFVFDGNLLPKNEEEKRKI